MGEPRERPILFSGPMIRAILEGRKTQTRRVVKRGAHDVIHKVDGELWRSDIYGMQKLHCPFGVPGDRLWCREAFGASPDWPDALTLPEYDGGHNQSRLIYRADEGRGLTEHYGIDFSRVRWFPSIHMPRWASRLTLRVTSVRVERLQSVAPRDILAEGVVERSHTDPVLGKMPISAFDGRAYVDLVSLWAAGWGSINGKRAGCAWRDNPWVWAVGFDVERRAS